MNYKSKKTSFIDNFKSLFVSKKKKNSNTNNNLSLSNKLMDLKNNSNITIKKNSTSKSNKNIKIIIIIFIVLFILFLLYLLLWYIKYSNEKCYEKKTFRNYLVDHKYYNPCVYKDKPTTYKERKIIDDKEVFHISDQKYTYEQAKCKCNAYNAELADQSQIIKSYNKGANWCSYGWSKGQNAYYPIQKCYWDKLNKDNKDKIKKCGKPGINGGYFNSGKIKFGINCYGVKPKGAVEIPKDPICPKKDICELPKNYNSSVILDTDNISPFSDNKWSKYN